MSPTPAPASARNRSWSADRPCHRFHPNTPPTATSRVAPAPIRAVRRGAGGRCQRLDSRATRPSRPPARPGSRPSARPATRSPAAGGAETRARSPGPATSRPVAHRGCAVGVGVRSSSAGRSGDPERTQQPRHEHQPEEEAEHGPERGQTRGTTRPGSRRPGRRCRSRSRDRRGTPTPRSPRSSRAPAGRPSARTWATGGGPSSIPHAGRQSPGHCDRWALGGSAERHTLRGPDVDAEVERRPPQARQPPTDPAGPPVQGLATRGVWTTETAADLGLFETSLVVLQKPCHRTSHELR